MERPLTRKQFFREMARRSLNWTSDLLDPPSSRRQAPAISSENSLAADLPPELLELEALRLGLSPDNPQQVIEALNSELQKSGG